MCGIKKSFCHSYLISNLKKKGEKQIMKLFNKVAAIAVGVTLAAGVGAGIALGNREFKEANAASIPNTYTKLTTSNLSSLTTSDKVVIVATISGNATGVTGYSGSDATVSTTVSEWTEFTVTAVDTTNETYSLKDGSTNKWISLNASNKFTIASSSATNLVADSSGYFKYSDSNSDTRYLAKNDSYYRCYKGNSTSGYTYFYVYKAPASSATKLATPEPTYSNGNVTWANISNASSYDLTIDGGSAIHNATSPYDVSDLAAGSHTVTVTAIGNGTTYSNSDAGSVSFAIVIHAGTESDPYTVAEAKAVAYSGDTNVHYVAGYIAKVSGDNIFMSDDITSTFGDFELYGSHTNNTGVTLVAHYYIVAHGSFTKYNTTAEATSCTIDSVEYVTIDKESISVSLNGSVNVSATTNGSLTWAITNGTGSATLSNQSNTGATVTGTSEGDATLKVTRGHYYVECPITVSAVAYPTSTLTVGTNTADVTWPTSDQHLPSVYNDGFTFELAGTDSNTGNFNKNNTDWRMYQTGSATLTISSSTRKIVKVNVVYNISNTGVLTYNGVQYESASTITVGGLFSATFGVGNTTSATNGQVRLKSITVYYEEVTLDYIEITGSMTKTQYELGVDTEWDPSGLIVTAYYVNDAADPFVVTNNVTWSYSSAFPSATVTNLSLTVTATLNSDNTKTDSVDVTVSVITAIPVIEDGEEYILAYPASNYYFTGINDSGSTDFGIATQFVAFPKIDYVLTAVENGDGTFSFETKDSTYLAWTTGNSLKEIASIDASAKWNVTKNNDGSAAIEHSTDSTRFLQFNASSGQQRFATYAGTNHDPFLIPVDAHALAGNFVECYMHPEIAHNPLDGDSGACKDSGSGYYTAAQTAYSQLSADVKSEFAGNSDFANYVARLTAWASANGYTFDAAAGTFTKNNAKALTVLNVESSTAATVVVVITAMVSITAVGGFFLLKRKPI